MVWPRSLGRNDSKLFVIIKLMVRAIRICIMEIFFFFFAIAMAGILKVVLQGPSIAKFSLLKSSYLIKTQPGFTRCGFCHVCDCTNCLKVVIIATGRN